MAKCVFKNLTPNQAETLARWFSGAGEQDCEFWFREHCEDPAPIVEPGQEAIQQDENGDVTVETFTP